MPFGPHLVLQIHVVLPSFYSYKTCKQGVGLREARDLGNGRLRYVEGGEEVQSHTFWQVDCQGLGNAMKDGMFFSFCFVFGKRFILVSFTKPMHKKQK
jgi:hypothetical protein